MKKILAACMMVLSLVLLCGCATLVPNTGGSEGEGGGDATSPLAEIAAKYEKCGEATGVLETVEIESGDLLQYRSEKTFAKEGSEFSLTEKITRLNPLTEEEPYSETETKSRVAAATFSASLTLNELYFNSWNIEEGVLTAKVRDDSIQKVLSLSGSLPKPVHELTLVVTSNPAHITEIGITFLSGSSTVSISISISY